MYISDRGRNVLEERHMFVNSVDVFLDELIVIGHSLTLALVFSRYRFDGNQPLSDVPEFANFVIAYAFPCLTFP